MRTEAPAALPEGYYLANFHKLAAFVARTYRDILTPAERQWYASIQASSESAQRLYIRLLTRKGSVFRLGRLNYQEIKNLRKAADELATKGLADTALPDDLTEILAAFTKSELLQLLSEPSLVTDRVVRPSSRTNTSTDKDSSNRKKTLTRVELVGEILASAEPERSAYVKRLQEADEWISLLGHQHWVVFRLGFFGNLYQDSSEFVLQELGTVQYENYQLDASARPFATRRQLDAHLRYFECATLFDTIDIKSAQQMMNVVNQLPAPIPGDEHLQRRVDRLRNRVARQLERLDLEQQALALYAATLHPPARERRVRLYLKRNQREAAARLLGSMQERPFNDAEAQVAERLQQQLQKLNGHKHKALTRYRPQSSTLTLNAGEQSVECAARQFYTRLGSCHFTENALVNAVLGLFIWDIIFHPVRGAFFNPFQSAPSDFYQPSFASRRAKLLIRRFEQMDNPLLFVDCVLNAYDVHQDKANPLVRWGRIDRELISLALHSIPVEHWLLMFQRILSDTRDNTSGFPDLVLFRNEGGYEFIEVKGPGDVVQPNQLRWMEYFDRYGIPCRVVKIRWTQGSVKSLSESSKTQTSVGNRTLPEQATPDKTLAQRDEEPYRPIEFDQMTDAYRNAELDLNTETDDVDESSDKAQR